MKTIYNMICAVMLVFLASACNSSNTSDLALTGDCSVEALELDGTYVGIINALTRTIKVKVPVDFNQKSAMTVSQLKISEGATADIQQGATVDFSSAQALKVTNGSMYLDWTIQVKNDEAKINYFIIDGTYKASINQTDHTITAYLPGTVDITKAIPTISYSEDAVIYPAAGVATDFSQPVVYTVTDNTATQEYTVVVKQVTKPAAIFVGGSKATTMEELDPEEKEACKWMLANINNSLFASWEDMKNGNVDLDECQVIWWHWQNQPSETLGDFESAATSAAMSCRNMLYEYYKNGGGFILSRAAVNFAASLGAVKDQRCANNCWGASDEGGDVLGSSWDFPVKDENHWMWQNVIGGASPLKTLDKDYQISNCVSQWGMWGDYTDHARWEELTGCRVLAHGWDNAITIWETPAADGSFGKGGIICFGSGCYDWYSPNAYEENYHKNVGIITGNAFNYLMK